MIPNHPKRLKKHKGLYEIDRQIAAITPEERLAAILAAAGVLGHLRDPRAIPLLAGAMRDDDNYDTRMLSLIALREIGSKPLLDALNNLPEEALHSMGQSAWELAKCDASAIEPLIETLVRSNETMRCIAANALGEIGDQRALPELDRMAQNAPTYGAM